MYESGTFFTFTLQNKVFINVSPLTKLKSKLFHINKSNQIFQLNEQPEKFIKGLATNNTFIGLTEKAVKVYCNLEMKCYGSISLKNTELSSFHYLTFKKQRTEFLVLHFKTKNKITLRIISVERNVEQVNRTLKTTHRSDFEKATSSLQSIILRVKNKLAPVNDQINHIRLKNRTDTLKHLFLTNSVVGEIKIVSKNLLTPSKLWKKVEVLQNELGILKAQLKINRLKRSVPNSGILNVAKLRVMDLVFNDTIKVPSLHLKADISTKSLQMKHLNDVPWNDFVTGIANKTMSINGTIRFQSPVHIGSLRTRKLNNLNTKKIFNFFEDQNITSNIFVSKGVFSSIIKCTLLNGLDIEKDISKINVNNVINCEYIYSHKCNIYIGTVLIKYFSPSNHKKYSNTKELESIRGRRTSETCFWHAF